MSETSFFSTSKKEKIFIKTFLLIAITCSLYLAATVIVEPPILRLAKITTIQNFFGRKHDRFTEKLAAHFPKDTSRDFVIKELEKSGFKVRELGERATQEGTRYHSITYMPSGLTKELSLASYDVVIITDFKSDRLINIKGLISIQAF